MGVMPFVLLQVRGGLQVRTMVGRGSAMEAEHAAPLTSPSLPPFR